MKSIIQYNISFKSAEHLEPKKISSIKKHLKGPANSKFKGSDDNHRREIDNISKPWSSLQDESRPDKKSS